MNEKLFVLMKVEIDMKYTMKGKERIEKIKNQEDI